ncbi:hypothetical protein [Parachitinimonas caeni]|uniref:Uncharacterized protein n=1 Tax=Parachitinimonas caeni TaxID=3031301 RepID=A0ABT7E2D7_9NEIS|nr:hypothetical protein [Parachitinimonas caeni]MDK2126470.1 hypothetical protein [Parachitinimonas caeni]
MTSENERRIAACVKACVGISTENLEQNRPLVEGLNHLNNRIRELEQQLEGKTGCVSAVIEPAQADCNLCYSLDGENYCYTDFAELVQDALENCDSEGIAGTTYYQGQRIQKTASEYFAMDDLISNMEDAAYDDAGESAEDFPDFSAAEKAELKSLISNWLDKNIKVSFWAVVDTEERTFSAEDVALAAQKGAEQ